MGFLRGNMLPALGIALAGMLWGATGPFVKHLNFHPASLAWFRTAIPFLLLTPFILSDRAVFKQGWVYLASGLNAMRMLFYLAAFTLTSVSNAVLLLYTYPALVTLLAWLFLSEKLTLKKIVWILLALLGTFIIYSQSVNITPKDYLGMSCMLASVILYSLSLIVFKKKGTAYSPSVNIVVQNFMGALLFLPFILIYPPASLVFTLTASLYAFLMGICGFGLFFYGIKHMELGSSAMLAYTEVPTALILGALFQHEQLSRTGLLGGALVMVAAVGLQWNPKRK